MERAYNLNQFDRPPPSGQSREANYYWSTGARSPTRHADATVRDWKPPPSKMLPNSFVGLQREKGKHTRRCWMVTQKRKLKDQDFR